MCFVGWIDGLLIVLIYLFLFVCIHVLRLVSLLWLVTLLWLWVAVAGVFSGVFGFWFCFDFWVMLLVCLRLLALCECVRWFGFMCLG